MLYRGRSKIGTDLPIILYTYGAPVLIWINQGLQQTSTTAPIVRFKGSDAAERDPHIIVIRNTSIGNLLDRCSLTVPCHDAGAAPVGFMLMGENMADKRLLGIGLSVDRLLSPNL